MIEIAVCDDEQRIREDLKARIEAEGLQCRVRCFASGRELLEQAAQLDIVFLDIGMQEVNGMEIAAQLAQYPGLLVIFVTAHEEHVFEAFDVGAFHYLLKPVDSEKFSQVLRKAVRQAAQMKERQPLQVKDGSSYRVIPLEQIYYAESNGRKILLHTETETVEFYGRMQELEKRLGEDFFRCHRGFLVHFRYVVGYDTANVYLKNDRKVYMAKQKYGEFSTAYLAYLRRAIAP